MRFNLSMVLIFLLCAASCSSKTYKITFRLDMNGIEVIDPVGIMGSTKPLSWDKLYPMSDDDRDGIYECTITFKTDKRNVRYKYTANDQIELMGADNRAIWFKEGGQTVTQIYDEYDYYDEERKSELVYTATQIQEDIATLARALEVIHPNLYKYQDELQYRSSLEILKREMLDHPDVGSIYKAVSKFAAAIRCSHTFTNPWNQGSGVEKFAFYQPDKLPVTFDRIGKRLFIDRNASTNQEVRKGLEVLSFDEIQTSQVLTTLAAYIASDGDNYEKKLQRLTMSGEAKFELFDLFYPLEYGSKETYELALLDYTTGDTIVSQLNAISRTRRNKILSDRYADFSTTFEEGWGFELINQNTALLKMRSFAIFNKDFDWKNYLDDVFAQLAIKRVEHFIIDIRGNEGGDGAVAEYVLERIITAPVKVNGSSSICAYKTIPEDLRPHISTWDKRPYDWGNKVVDTPGGKFKLKDRFEEKGKVYKPKKGGYKGKSYLLVDATNSSATHLMTMYVKEHQIATIIGQETGGNLKGTNGGYMFFMRLPNSRIEVDIPVFGINVNEDTPATYNGGVKPDIEVHKSVKDLINGVDTELAHTLKYIAQLDQQENLDQE